MAEKNAAISTAKTDGTPVVTSTSLTTTTVVPAPNPLMEPKNYMEVGAFILMLFAVFALIEKRIEKRRKEDAEFHKLSHDAIGKDIGDVKHDLKNQETMIHAIANNRTADVERIVKLELRQENIEKGQARIEHQIEKNHKETLEQMKNWAEQFSESIREVRSVKPRTD